MQIASFPDRLADAVRKYGPLCVGLDPRWEQLPAAFHSTTTLDGVAKVFEEFSCKVLELIRPYCGVVKPQAAFFELAGPAGMSALATVLARANQLGFVTILDAKRGDISTTATAYAQAAFTGCKIGTVTYPIWNADALTVNPYLGDDAIEPFLREARKGGRGIFVLVRTSNPGGGLFQNLISSGQPLYRHVADAVARWGADGLGDCGITDVGAVVGATHPAELAELRKAYPNMWFLVPGYGAQGGTAKDCQAAYRADGLGAIVSSSRGVVFPFKPEDPAWERQVIQAAAKAQHELSNPG